MKKYTKYWNIKNLLSGNLLFYILLYAQSSSVNWVDISLIDTVGYVSCYSETAAPAYPYSNLFDGSFKTCWVAGTKADRINPSLYIRLPKADTKFINLFSGYGKSRALYKQNARPRKIKLSVYAAFNPQGYVSEISLLYKAVKFHEEKIIELADAFMVRQIALDFPQQELSAFRDRAKKQFIAKFNQTISDTCLILQIEIMEIWQGGKYDDICISELFFNNRFIGFPGKNNSQISNIYLNAEENELLMDVDDQQKISVYRDISAVLQIIETSKDNKWAILISMPSQIEGRVETTYLLVDLMAQKIVNQDLEAITGNYTDGSIICFGYDEQGFLYLEYITFDNDVFRVYLK